MSIDSDVTLYDVVKLAVENETRFGFYTLPGIVKSYDKDAKTCTAEIAINNVHDDRIIRYPELEDVPVLLPRSKSGGFSFMLEEGDEVLLQFIQRSTGNWRQTAGVQEPDMLLDFDINDAVAVPCLHPRESGYEQREATEAVGKKVLIDAEESAQLTAPKLFVGDKTAIPAATTTIGQGTPIEVFNILQAILTAMTIPMQTPTGPATLTGPVLTDVNAILASIGSIIGEAE